MMVKHMKKTVGLIICYVVVVCSACTSVEHVDKEKIHKEAEQWMECIVKEDKEALLKYFASDIRDNDKEKTLKEIETAFEFIDGTIVSYELDDIYGGMEYLEDGKVSYHSCYPEFENVTTDSGVKYRVEFIYENIRKKEPQYEGLTMIVIKKVEETLQAKNRESQTDTKDNSLDEVVIGHLIPYDD